MRRSSFSKLSGWDESVLKKTARHQGCLRRIERSYLVPAPIGRRANCNQDGGSRDVADLVSVLVLGRRVFLVKVIRKPLPDRDYAQPMRHEVDLADAAVTRSIAEGRGLEMAGSLIAHANFGRIARVFLAWLAHLAQQSHSWEA